MNIGGYMPMTLSDYPGHVASVVFTQGCNFRCPFCHNGALIPIHPARAILMPEDEVLANLEKRKTLLQGVVITGGEPTLQPDLADFSRKIHEFGLKVKLDTNGSRPEMLEALIEEGLLDYVAMDVKAPYGYYDVMSGVPVSESHIRESIRLISESGVDHLFRTTLVPEMLNAEHMRALREMIPVGSFHVEQELQREEILDPKLQVTADVERELDIKFQRVGS